MAQLRVAVDIDGILSAYPEYFQFFIKAMQNAGAKVIVLTARPSDELEELGEVFKKVDINPDYLITMPEKMKEMRFPPGIYKAFICKYLQINVLYDDFQSNDPEMISDFFEYNQDTIPFSSFAYDPNKDKKK